MDECARSVAESAGSEVFRRKAVQGSAQIADVRGMVELRARGRDRERGASLVEFALVVPLLTLFLFGIVQFGIAYDKQQSINSAAREGARLGGLDSTTMKEVADRAVASYANSAAAGNDPEVLVFDSISATPTAGRSADGTYVTFTGTSTHPNPQPADEDNETLMPCGREPSSEYVRVLVSTPYDITIPFFGVMTVNIDSEAEFRCE